MLDRDLYDLSERCPDVWDIRVPGSTKLLRWRMFLDRLSSRVNLERRGVNIQSNLCPLWWKEEETIQHLFIRCDVSQSVWDKCDRWLGVISVRNENIINHLEIFMSLDKVEKQI